MEKKEIIGEALHDLGYDGTIYFSNDEFIDAIIGLTDDGRVVYDYDKMVEWFMKENDCSAEDAIDYIEYNTIRSLPYYHNAPIIVRGDFARILEDYKEKLKK